MYDMYPWDSASQGDYPPKALRSWRNPSRKARRDGSADPATARAVQVALDRRDNGGDTTQPATPPAAGQARQ